MESAIERPQFVIVGFKNTEVSEEIIGASTLTKLMLVNVFVRLVVILILKMNIDHRIKSHLKR